MAFITRLFKSSKPVVLSIIITLLLVMPSEAVAEGILPVHGQAVLTEKGNLDISSRFNTQLPESLKQALRQGVPLHFTLEYRLTAPTWTSYKIRFNHLIKKEDFGVTYKLSFHPITSRYRISVGTFSSEYHDLETALRGVGAIANWRVLPEGTLSGVASNDVKVDIRLSLSTSQLPKPFQINSLTAKNVQVDSGWLLLQMK